ncbi:TPA: O-antigen ligase RfaL [Proteus mirabilis]|uniref:O-antigen ligase RfaL n=1 Tax=Proteus mirabilis TaxID=584 RepID=UPI0018C4CD18|nr:O-antigen ligase RfaL [Proteus mirabilis]MBG3105292.1 O-antigen ligase RfaL [Proteus mirabilis]MCB6148622.1 O-antigen ligase RfaL [Proteus mirabilis]MCT0102330.1 O-antigen ligase RfaL [Proteus mirabilis]MDC9739977.1 O-antigen ligase RfaL [Proteus mirabilis]MDC9746927.1 O-antigen ligase RfaL [Proteus mirabilis]
MMLFKDDSKKSLWNLSIIGLYIILIYLPDITRYKNIVMGLIGATALWYLVRDFRTIGQIFKNNLAYALFFLLLAIGYSVVISVEPALSLKEMNKPILNGLLLFAIAFPIVLYKETPTAIAKMVMVSFAMGLLVIMAKELVQYYLEYQKNIKPFTWGSQLAHREISYALLFFFPIILALWALKKNHSIINWLLLSVVSLLFLFAILGTLARGAWVALAISTLLILIINRQWVLILISILACVLLFISITNLPPNPVVSKFFQYKLTQTNSGLRFDGGTQGSALDLILEQPIKGYGYGNQLYHNVYNQQVKQHKNWFFKKSIGPHNVFLAFWFAGGILGLISLLYFCASFIAQGIQLIRKNQGIIRQAALVLLISFLGVYVLRGLFENAYINQVGILLGLMLALRYSLLNQPLETPKKEDKSVS